MIGGTGNGHAAAWPVGHGCRGHRGPGTGTVTVELRVIPSRNRAGLPGAAAAAVGNHWHSVAAAAAWVTVATAGSRVSLGSGPTSPAVGAGLESRSLSARPSSYRAVSAAAATGHEPEALAWRLACAAVTEHRDRAVTVTRRTVTPAVTVSVTSQCHPSRTTTCGPTRPVTVTITSLSPAVTVVCLWHPGRPGGRVRAAAVARDSEPGDRDTATAPAGHRGRGSTRRRRSRSAAAARASDNNVAGLTRDS